MKNEIIIKTRDVLKLDNYLELDFSKFIVVNVNTIGMDESNKFLNSLWREFNLELSPENLDRCPWAYFPQKLTTSKSNISYFGCMRTKLSKIHVAISYKKKGSIDNIHFFSDEINGEDNKNKAIFKSIVSKAKENMHTKFKYTVLCKIIGKYESDKSVKILSDYTGELFDIYVHNGISYIKFIIYAQDLTDVYKSINIKLRLLMNFLSIETNIYFEYCNVRIYENDEKNTENIECSNIYQEEIYADDLNSEDNKFIDFYPSYEGKVILSRDGVNFIDKIFCNDEENTKFNIFMNSCYHFRQGLAKEYDLANVPYEVSATSVMKLSRINQPEATSIIDGALTYYLSAIETATLINYEPQKCEMCGQMKFQINKRVKEFINTHLWDTHGDIFKKLYNLRSKYLHVGESYTTSAGSYIRPLLDNKTATGCVDSSFITLNINEKAIGFSTSNIREWTSYSLRNFYKNYFKE